jgi:hypothetical protein
VTAPAPTLPPVTAPPVTAAPVTLPPATLPPNAAVNDEIAIRRVVSDYGRAIESKDIELFRALKPNLSPEDEGRLRDSFRNLESQKVSITIQSIDVSGTTARVRVSRRDTINNQSVNAFNQTLVLGKGPGGWTIREIGR